MNLCSENKLVICLKEEVNGKLVMPNEHIKCIVSVTTCGIAYYQVLEASNCFSASLYALLNATYMVVGIDQEIEYYIVNGQTMNHAQICFDTKHQEVCLVMKSKACLTNVQISKKRFDACNQEMGLEGSYPMVLSGNGKNYPFELSCDNHYQIQFDGLSEGWYELHEKINEGERLIYDVNGVKQEINKFYLEGMENTVVSETHEEAQTHCVRITRWDDTGDTLVLPDSTQSFEVKVYDGKAYKEYTLNCMNHFSVLLEFDKNDCIRVESLDPLVRYEVNGNVVCVAEFIVDQDSDVRIIGHTQIVETFMMRIQRFIEEDGHLIIPSVDQSYEVIIEGYQDEVVVLDKNNGFSAILSGIKKGYYRVMDAHDDSNIRYEINGKAEEDGYVYVDQDTVVYMIETKSDVEINGNVTIEQRIGTLASNEVVNTGTYVASVNDQLYELNEGNAYCLSLELAKDQEVKVSGISETNEFRYMLDGVTHENEIIFTNIGSNYEAKIITNPEKIIYKL